MPPLPWNWRLLTEIEKIDLAAQFVAPAWTEQGVSSLLRIARLVRWVLNGRSSGAAPTGRQKPSLRALARHPLLQSAELSYAVLRRAMLVLRLTETHPEVSALKLSDTHLCMIAGLPSNTALQLLTQAAEQSWSTDKLDVEARQYRRGGGRPAEAPLVRALGQVSRALEGVPTETLAFPAAPPGNRPHVLPAGTAIFWAHELDGVIERLLSARDCLQQHSATRPELLVIDRHPSRGQALARALEKRGHAVRVCRMPEQAVALRRLTFASAVLVVAPELELPEEKARALGEKLVSRGLALSYLLAACEEATAPEAFAQRILKDVTRLLTKPSKAE